MKTSNCFEKRNFKIELKVENRKRNANPECNGLTSYNSVRREKVSFLPRRSWHLAMLEIILKNLIPVGASTMAKQ